MKLSARELLIRNTEDSIQAKQDLLSNQDLIEGFEAATHRIQTCYREGGRLYIAGNGGSAADAQHLAAEFVSKLARPRAPLPAEALTVDTSVLTALGNDFGYDEIFARQIAAKMRTPDVFLALTTSGKSKNIVRALEQCRSQKIVSVLFTGGDGGPAQALADITLIAPGASTSRIQECHAVLYHTLCESIETALFF